MSERPSAACPHCGTAVELGGDRFCCPGCAQAWEIIHGAGLAAYYDRREATPDRPEVGSTDWNAVPVEGMPNGRCLARLQVEGLHCAACVWVTERVLGSVDGVSRAQVSYASGRATLEWDPTQTELPELAGMIEALGYRPRVLGQSSAWDRGLLLRLGFAAFAAMNIMLLSASLYAGWASSMDPRFVTLFQWTALALATPLTLWAASPFFTGAIEGLKRRVLHMDLPIALAVALLYGHAVIVTATRAGDAYLDSLAMLVTLLLAGRVLESHGRRRTAEAAMSLAATVPVNARLVAGDGSVRTVPASELIAGMKIAAGLGQELAADGVVVDGAAQLDTSILTGESRPTEVGVGSVVRAGTLILEGSLIVEVQAAGEETELRRMAQLVRDSADRAAEPGFTDRIAPWFTALTLVVAAVTGGIWIQVADVATAIPVVVAVLVVACPCALALAQPLIGTAGIGAIARRGLLVRGPDVIRRLAKVDLVALDKTGTVTRGKPRVTSATDEILRLAAGLERFSSHPIAKSILEAAVERGIALPFAIDLREVPGEGVEGVVDGLRYRLRQGDLGMLRLERQHGDHWALVGEVCLQDELRIDAAEVADGFRGLGLPVTLLTGDQSEIAQEVGEAIGADEVLAGVRPAEKTEWINQAQAAGRNVLFAGDGINDAPALSNAYVGIAMGSGADTSILAADGVIAGESIQPLIAGLRIAAQTVQSVKRTQIRSIVYNVVAVSLAATGFVNPLVAAILMPLSSGLVLASALSIERFAQTVDSPKWRGGPQSRSARQLREAA